MGETRLEGAARITYAHHATAARCAETDKPELEEAVEKEAERDRWAPVVEALPAIKGIDVASALCLAAEAGSFSRLGPAEECAGWRGLTPSGHPPGGKGARGHVAKCGSAATRRALAEAPWRFAGCSAKPKGLPPGREASAETGRRGAERTRRLVKRHPELVRPGHSSRVTNTACAREPACRAWGVGRRAEGAHQAQLASRIASLPKAPLPTQG